jgi:cyclohexyl-isocyanide hydratase
MSMSANQGAFVVVEAIHAGMTQLDFTGPHLVFSNLPGSQAITASVVGGKVESEGGLLFSHTRRLADIERCDVLFVPGGLVATNVLNDFAYMAQIARLGAGAGYLTSVCTGSLILGAAGLLKGRRAACHWASRHMLTLFGAEPDSARVVRDGNIITGGVTAGTDFALVVAAEFAGKKFAQAMQLQMECSPGRPETASHDVWGLGPPLSPRRCFR